MYSKCPYKSRIRRICVHKGAGQKTSRKRRCGYSNELKCPLYLEWLSKSRKVSPSYLKMLKNTLGEME